MRLADSLADGDHDTLPTNHRSEPEEKRYGNLHPNGDVVRRRIELAMVGVERLHVALVGQTIQSLNFRERGRHLIDVTAQGAAL